MNAEEARLKLDPFVYKYDGRQKLRKVAFRNGKAYATNGSIAVVADVSDGCCPGEEAEFPYDEVNGFFSNVVKPSKWYAIDSGQFKAHVDDLIARANKERAEREHDWRGRYKYVSCPCCGEDVLWDTWSEELVTEKEKYTPVEYDSIDMSAELSFGGTMTTVVRFGYLFKLFKHLGSGVGEGVLFSLSTLNGGPVVVARTEDWSVRAILCVCKVCGNGFKPDAKLDAKEVG